MFNPPPTFLRGKTPCKRLLFSKLFSRGRSKRGKGRKFPPSRTFPLRLRKRQRRAGSLWMGGGKEGRLAACNNTVLAKLQVCRETLTSFPPWLDSLPLFGKAQGRWEDQDGGVGDSGHASGSGATSFLFLRCWRKGGG